MEIPPELDKVRGTKQELVKDPLLLLIKKQEKHQMFVMKFVSNRGMTFILIGRSAIQQICFLTLIYVYPFIR